MVEDIIIRSIELPDVIKSAIEAKIVEQQKLATYDFMLQVEKKNLKEKRLKPMEFKIIKPLFLKRCQIN